MVLKCGGRFSKIAPKRQATQFILRLNISCPSLHGLIVTVKGKAAAQLLHIAHASFCLGLRTYNDASRTYNKEKPSLIRYGCL